MAAAPADWYPDPKHAERLRYWNGVRWTGYYVDRERPEAVRYETPPWTPYVPGSTPAGINVPLTVAVTAAF